MDCTFTQRVQELAARIEPYLIEKRRFFHAHPELSGEEVNTTAAIAQELDAMGIEYALPNDFIPGPVPAHYTESENLASLKEAGKAFIRQDVEARGVLTNAANRKNASETTKDRATSVNATSNQDASASTANGGGESTSATNSGCMSTSTTKTSQGGSTISSQSGLIVTIRGEAPDAYDEQGRPRHRIVLRSDIDALPILEQTGA